MFEGLLVEGTIFIEIAIIAIIGILALTSKAIITDIHALYDVFSNKVQHPFVTSELVLFCLSVLFQSFLSSFLKSTFNIQSLTLVNMEYHYGC